MNAIEALLSRRSIPAQCLVEPGPDDAQLARAFEAVLRAPDHGRMRPWRFKLIRGAARGRFAEMLVRTAQAREPDIPERQLDKLRARPLHAPLVIAVSARLRDNPKVPEVEQLLSAGAGLMNLLNALHLQGFGAITLTGASVYDPAVAQALGYANGERLLCFVYVGTVGTVVPAAPERPTPAEIVSEF